MGFTIVGKRFTVDQFRDYVAGIKLDTFVPSFVVIHNTAAPSLAQRPQGLTAQHIENLHAYYESKGWNGGPHLFVDDLGIWVFNPLSKRGVHSPSWNGKSWGIEMLGDFDTESPTDGRGAKVLANAAAAAAILLAFRGLPVSTATIMLHREDKATTHACPGAKVSKAMMLERIHEAMADIVAADKWTVKDGAAKVIATGLETGPLGTGLVRDVVNATGGVLIVDGQNKMLIVSPRKNLNP